MHKLAVVSESNLLELAGGRARLREVLADFYDRVFADTMIGFFFAKADKTRLIDKELELTLRALGADVEYTGRSMRSAHSAHHIMGGQFDRRLQILRETLADHDIPDAVRDAWISHTQSLRSEVTADPEGECNP